MEDRKKRNKQAMNINYDCVFFLLVKQILTFSNFLSFPVAKNSSIFWDIFSPTPGSFLASFPDVTLSGWAASALAAFRYALYLCMFLLTFFSYSANSESSFLNKFIFIFFVVFYLQFYIFLI